MPLLSKSKFLNGIQCPRLLWASIHKKEMIPEFDIGTINTFKEGNEVGELAKKLFPDGINLPTEDFKLNIQLSKEALTQNKPLFEVSFPLISFCTSEFIITNLLKKLFKYFLFCAKAFIFVQNRIFVQSLLLTKYFFQSFLKICCINWFVYIINWF